jgi:predicted nucleotidyltransferase
MIHRMSDVLVYNAPASLDVNEIRRRLTPVLARHGATWAFLIGSYARGSADAWSDIDLVVVMPTERPFVDRARGLSDVLDAVPVAVDLLVYTPQEFDAGVRRDRGVFHLVAQEGVQIL